MIQEFLHVLTPSSVFLPAAAVAVVAQSAAALPPPRPPAGGRTAAAGSAAAAAGRSERPKWPRAGTSARRDAATGTWTTAAWPRAAATGSTPRPQPPRLLRPWVRPWTRPRRSGRCRGCRCGSRWRRSSRAGPSRTCGRTVAGKKRKKNHFSCFLPQMWCYKFSCLLGCQEPRYTWALASSTNGVWSQKCIYHMQQPQVFVAHWSLTQRYHQKHHYATPKI